MSQRMKVRTMEQMRDKMLEAFDKLVNHEIDTVQAAAMAKMCDSVVGTFKLQIEYAKMTNSEPNLPFLHTEKLISHDRSKLIGND